MSHLSSDGCTLPGFPRRACGCQSCRHRFGPPIAEARREERYFRTHCQGCGDPFTTTGPAAQSMAFPGFCVFCFTEGGDR